MRIAAIDIGSNAARLLINEVTHCKNGQPEFTKLNLLRVPLRLGMDVFSFGEIREEREDMMIRTMKIFSDLMDMYKVEHYRACATSAMRDASNGAEIRQKVKDTSGISIEIITGDEEAALIFENQIAETMDENFGYLYIDVGGGSTELMYFEKEKMKYKKSFNIGTIRLLKNLVSEEQWSLLKSEVKENINKKNIIGIGSGGNINKIASMNKTKEGKTISLNALKKYHHDLSQLTVTERMHHYQLREDRADVLVPALEIYTKIMTWADISHILVPKISVADGLVHSIYNKLNNKNKV